MANIGFAGLGHMGLPMAKNLRKAGHFVTGFDLSQKACDSFKALGGNAVASIKELAVDKDIIFTMLQTGKQVESVCTGSDGLFKHASPKTLFIDCSTIDVQSARTFHEHALTHHFQSLDAPVSGGVAGAEKGVLTFMVGGDREAFETAKPFLDAMGKNIIHAGGNGSGQAAKICNNMVLGISMIAISEAFKLGEKLGLDGQKLHEVVTHASGNCWAMTNYVPKPGILDHVPSSHDYEPGFTSAMMLKDLKLSQLSAEQAHLETKLGAQASALYQQWVDEGYGEKDFSSIFMKKEL